MSRSVVHAHGYARLPLSTLRGAVRSLRVRVAGRADVQLLASDPLRVTTFVRRVVVRPVGVVRLGRSGADRGEETRRPVLGLDEIVGCDGGGDDGGIHLDEIGEGTAGGAGGIEAELATPGAAGPGGVGGVATLGLEVEGDGVDAAAPASLERGVVPRALAEDGVVAEGDERLEHAAEDLTEPGDPAAVELERGGEAFEGMLAAPAALLRDADSDGDGEPGRASLGAGAAGSSGELVEGCVGEGADDVDGGHAQPDAPRAVRVSRLVSVSARRREGGNG